jgi:anion-transporting  ArsA/GET3 family ATPase
MAARSTGVMQLLAAKEMVVVCGSGGTGKTTIAAALGARAARDLGGRVLVLTVDPARRLASALGLDTGTGPGIGHDPVRVADAAFSAAGRPARGELWVAMLDTKAGWDELIRRHAPDPALRDQVLANPLYQNVTGRFVHSHDYIAMEKLHELHASGDYDLVIIDTPPSRNALDLLDAPGRMKEFFGSRLLRWLTVPYRSRLFTVASKPFYQVADRVLGSRFLQDIAEFFILFQSMERGFVARADQIETLLTDDRTTFIVVSTLEAAPSHEARFLVDELRHRDMPLGAVVINRSLPTRLGQQVVARAATVLANAAEPADEAMVEVATLVGATPASVAGVLHEAADRFRDVAVIAAREAERRRDLQAVAPLVGEVPTQPSDVHDLAGLLDVADALR